MENWKQGFYEAVREFLIQNSPYGKADMEESFVTDVWQDDPSPWYCDTCGPDPVTLTIIFERPNGDTFTHMWYGSMGELISRL